MFALLDRLVEEQTDPAAMSLLPDWTIGHVLSHLARNADGMRTMIEGAAAREQRPMYASTEARDADIEAGAARPLEALVDDVRSSAGALEAAWAGLDERGWAGTGLTLRGSFPVDAMPGFRWREVEVHLADLGLDAFGIDDWSDAYVAWDTEARRTILQARGVEIPGSVEAAPPPQRLAWMLGRTVDGLPEPPPF